MLTLGQSALEIIFGDQSAEDHQLFIDWNQEQHLSRHSSSRPAQ